MLWAFRALSHCFFLLLLANRLDAALARPANAPPTSRATPSNDWTPPEQWAGSQIEIGEAADFDKRPECKGALAPDPKDEKDARWRNDCRKISHRFLEDLLTQAPWREATPIAGVPIAHARIVGDVDLENATLVRVIAIGGSRIEGAINLMRARTDSLIFIGGTLITGNFTADGFHSKSDLFIRNATVLRGETSLRGAKVAGRVDMIGASFEDALDADSMLVGGALLMRSESENKTSFKQVVLRGAKVTGQIDMSGAAFEGVLSIESLHVDGDLFLRNVRAGATADIVLTFARIGGNIDLQGANLASVDLSSATVDGDFRVGKWEQQSTSWSLLNLRNAHVDYLTDARDAWPEQGRLILDGFAFDHLGAFKDGSTTQTRNLDMNWWDRWARRDPIYSPAPYVQLAAALKNTGDNDASNEIRYLGRERARAKVCENGTSFECLFQSLLAYTVGYGIGRYNFFALGWVVFLSALTTFVLKVTVREARGPTRSWFWCFGASLSRLLPGIELDKDFTEFFNWQFRPRLFNGLLRPRFNFLQGAWFYFIRFAGFVLGAALVAAFAGLTQGP